MNKKEVKNILISMRTPENEIAVNHLLGQLDMKSDTEIEQITERLGNSEQNIRETLSKKIEGISQSRNDEKYPINDMFTYGISGNCIHLHLPTDLHELMAKNGISKTIALVNLQLLEAIDKIKEMRDGGFYRFKDKDSIYMISPAVIKREMKFLEELDFTTNSYSKKQLSDEKFVQETPEAQLATHIFGHDKNVGTALIRFEQINSKQWQEKKNEIVANLREKTSGIEHNKNVER